MVNLNGIFIVLILVTVGRECVAQKLLLSVFYESQCPDSKAFVLQQLQPTIQVLQDYVKLQLVPFGKSRSINYGDDGFECQHGPSECLGNIVQDCSLNEMRARNDVDRVSYVACEMATEAGSRGDLECIQKAHLSADTVEQCVLTGKGITLQLQSEYFTSLVAPTFVPTVTINNQFDQQIQNSSQTDLFGTLCSILKETPPCARHYNNMALNNLLYRRSSENFL